jgi:multidrug efflux pump subunit AcrA (membrane-fusion protein)
MVDGMKKIIVRVLALVVVLAAGWGAYRFIGSFSEQQATVPVTAVRQSDVVIRSYTRGELQAVRSETLYAPNLFGTVQITQLAPLGAFAREKDLVVEFDDSEVRSRVEEKQLQIEQLQEQLRQQTAQLDITQNQDQVDLLRARYSVRGAELDVKRNPLLSSIDQTKNQLNLQSTQKRLEQLQTNIEAKRKQAQAQLDVSKLNIDKAQNELRREQMRLRQVRLLSPISGLVAIRQNRGGGGPGGGGGMNIRGGIQVPDLREGDQVQPGTPIADVLDLSEVQITAKVGELDRANLYEGQEATVRLDAVPDKVFHAKIKSLSGTASANMWSGDPSKKFDVVFSVDMKELMTGLGAKPEQIREALATAERNRNRPAASAGPAFRFGGGGRGGDNGGGPPMFGDALQPGGQGGGMRGMRGQGGEGGQGGQQGEGGGMRAGRGGQGGQGGRPGGGNSDQVRAAMQKLLNGRNIQDLSPEERQKLGEQMSALMGGQGRGGQRGGGEGGQQGAEGRQRGFGGQGGQGGEGGGMRAGRGGPGGQGGGIEMREGFGMGATQRYSDAELAAAKLPPPPEQDAGLNILLRPGLLADVEIIVDKVPNAIHVPNQAVFEKEGKLVVYVRKGDQFVERVIKPLKQSESVTIVAGGLQPGEMVALSDPFADKSQAKKDESKKGGSKGPALPAGGGRKQS